MKAFGAIAFLFTFTCSESAAVEDPRRELLQGWGDQLIVGLYSDFHAEAEVLRSGTQDLCADKSAESLEGVRDSWNKARSFWKQAEVFAFGPFEEAPVRLGSQIDFWPARPDTIEDLLTGDVDAERIKNSTATERGLPALEYLLFADDILSRVDDETTCMYLEGIAGLLVEDARAIRDAWDPEGGNFLAQLTDPEMGDSMYGTLQMALGEVINRMGFTLENIQRDKLGKPLGEDTQSVSVESIESRFSGRAIEDIRDNLKGLRLLYFGEEERSIPSIQAYLLDRGRDFDEQIEALFAACESSLDSLEPDLADSLKDKREQVLVATEAMRMLKAFIQTDLMNALGVNQTFNDADGD